MFKNFLTIVVAALCSGLYAQSSDLVIIAADGGHTAVPLEDIRHITFAMDRTHALVIDRKSGEPTEAKLTGIGRISFESATAVRDNSAAGTEIPE